MAAGHCSRLGGSPLREKPDRGPQHTHTHTHTTGLGWAGAYSTAVSAELLGARGRRDAFGNTDARQARLKLGKLSYTH